MFLAMALLGPARIMQGHSGSILQRACYGVKLFA